MQFPLGKLQLLEVASWRFCAEFGIASAKVGAQTPWSMIAEIYVAELSDFPDFQTTNPNHHASIT